MRKDNLTEKLSSMRLPEIILPKFSLNCYDNNDRVLIQISNGSVVYNDNQQILSNINFSVFNKNRIAIVGDNSNGKSTLVKAILNDENISKYGDWLLQKKKDIGYLDQHYSTLDHNKSVFDTVAELMPNWSLLEVRSHLNDFLFRKNEEVNAFAGTLSGGEKARLSLAIIAAIHPKLLV
ncbi:MAG: ABC-F family ATP-binding cassette domain-containing protein, partial [Sphingobacteriaceae bacterium]